MIKMKFFLVFFAYLNQSVFGLLLDQDVYILEANDKHCSMMFCDGSLDYPFENLIQATSFVHSNNMNNTNIHSINFLILSQNNFIKEEYLKFYLNPNANGVYNLDFSFKKILIGPHISNNSVLFYIEAPNFFLSYWTQMIFQNIDFVFNFTKNTINDSFLQLKEYNLINLINCSFSSLNFQINFLSLISSSKNLNNSIKNISINILDCFFNKTPFNNGILNINSSFSAVLIERTSIFNTEVFNDLFIFSFFGSFNNISLRSLLITNSSNLIYIDNNSICRMSLITVNNTNITSNLIQINFSNKVIIDNSIINNINASSFMFVALNFNNSVFLNSNLFSNLILQRISSIIQAKISNLIEINNTLFDKITLISSSLLYLNTSNSLNINQTMFLSCNSYKSNGLIYSENSDLKIDNCYFNNISSFSNNAGIFFVNKSDFFFLANSVFLNGIGDGYGGILFVNTVNKVNIMSNFCYNQTYGSATLFFFFKFCEILIENLFVNQSFSFFENTTIGGNIVGFYSNNITIKNSCIFSSKSFGIGTILTFENFNIVKINNFTLFDLKTMEKGIIFFGSENIIEFNNSFISESHGSYMIGFIFQKNNEILVFESLFLDFIGENDYGGVFNLMENNKILIKNCFIYNITSFSGSGMFLLLSNTLIAINLTCDNHINFNKFYYGGILSIQTDNIITLIDSKFINSQAPNGAAAISLDTNTTLLIDSCLFYNLSLVSNPHGQGTIIYMYHYSNVTIKNSKFMSSQGYYGGGVFCTRDNVIIIQSSMFFNLTTHNQSTAVGGWTQNTFIVQNSSFIYNVCTFSGGLFFIDEVNVANFSNIYCIYSYSKSSGGAFYINFKNQITIQNSTFLHSEADSSGGFIYINRNNTILISNILSIESFSQEFGSFAYVYENNVISFVDSQILNTTISMDGGIFYIFQKNNVTIENLEIVNTISMNTEANGGIIYGNSDNGIIFLHNLIRKVSGINSGGVFFLNSANILICKNTDFMDISIFFGGTLMYISENNFVDFEKINGDFMNSLNFGTIYMAQNNFCSINHSLFSNITTNKYDGGLFYLKFLNKMEFFNCYYSFSISGGYGGFVYLDFSNKIIVKDSYFFNVMTSSQGDFIYSSQNNVIFLNKIIINNEKFYKKSQSVLIYLNQKNNLDSLNLEILQQNCHGEGCLFYSLTQNFINLYGFTINNLHDSSEYMVLTMRDNNILTTESGEITLNAHTNDNNNYLKAYFANLINSTNVTISFSRTMNAIYLSLQNNFFYILNEKMTKTNIVNNYLVSNEKDNSFIKLKGLKFNFIIISSIINVKSSIVIINQCYFSIRTNDVILFIIYDNSSLKVTRSSFINKGNYQFQILDGTNSKITLVNNFVFNLQNKESGNIFNIKSNFSAIKISNNIFTKSANLESSFSIIMNFSKTLFTGNLNSDEINKSTKFLAQKNHFFLCKGIRGGSFQISSSVYVTINITQNYFKYNSAEYGGDLYIKSTSLLIANNSFYKSKVKKYSNNSDIKKGGSIFFSDPNENLTLSLFDNAFKGNKAEVGSSIYFDLKDVNLNLSNNTFEDNNALSYGTPFASKAQKIMLVSKTIIISKADNHFFFLNIISGHEYSDCLFEIFLVDNFDQVIVKTDEKINLTISQIYSSPIDLNNSLNFIGVDGHFCFNGPFTRNQLPIQAKFKYSIFYGTNILPIIVLFQFRDCKLGERLTELYECKLCEEGTYSFATDFSSPFLCKPCKDSDPFICQGGQQVTPKNDYWRLDLNSNNFMKCPQNDICFQSNSSTEIYTNACEKGYTGPLCNVCQENFGKIDKKTCMLCSVTNWHFFILINFKILFKSFYFLYSIYVGFKMIVGITLHKFSNNNVIALSLLKLMIIHFQILSYIPAIPLKLTNQFQTAISAIMGFFPEVSDVFFFDCYFKNQNIKINLTYFILIMCPIYILVMYLISFVVLYYSKPYKKLKKLNNHINAFDLMKILFYVIIFLSFVDICQVYLELFQCVNIGDDNRKFLRLYNNLNIDCDDFSHQIWVLGFAIPVLLILFAVVLFLFIKITITLKKSNLDQSITKFMYGYFFYSYEEQFFYWDFVSLIRRVFSLFIFLYFYDKVIKKNVFPLILIYILLVIFFLLVCRFQPYKKKYKILNKIEEISLVILSLNYIILSLYCSYYFYKNENQDEITVLTIFSLIFVNGIFLFFWIKYYYSYYLKNKIIKLFQKIFAKKNEYSQIIKQFLIRKRYFYDYKENLNTKKMNVYLYFDVYENLLLDNTMKITKKLIESSKHIISERNYFKFEFHDYKRLLKFKKVTKPLVFASDNKAFELSLFLNCSGLNNLEYFLNYKFIIDSKEELSIENYGVYNTKSKFYNFFYLIKIIFRKNFHHI